MIDLNYVPFKELAVLCLHFQGLASSQVTLLVCSKVCYLLDKSAKFADVFREVGLFNMLSELLNGVAVLLIEEAAKSPKMKSTASDGDISGLDELAVIAEEHGKRMASKALSPGPAFLENFSALMSCLCKLLRDNETNLQLFLHDYKSSLFNLLRFSQVRPACLFVIRQIILSGYLYGAVLMRESKSPSISPTGGMADQNSDFVRLLEIMQSAPRFELALKADILQTVTDLMRACFTLKNVFRDFGGFVCVVSLLIGLEGVYNTSTDQQPPNLKAPTRQDATRLLQSLATALMEAMADHAYNRKFFLENVGFNSAVEGLRLSGALGASGDPELVLGILFGVAVENRAFYSIYSNVTGQKAAVTDGSENTNAAEANSADATRKNDLLESPIPSPKKPTAIEATLDRISSAIWTQMSGPSVILRNPHAISAILDLLPHIEGESMLQFKVFTSLHALSFSNRRNQVLLNQIGVLYYFFQHISQAFVNDAALLTLTKSDSARNNPDAAIKIRENEVAIRLSRRLMEMGLSTAELHLLFEEFQNIPGLEIAKKANGAPLNEPSSKLVSVSTSMDNVRAGDNSDDEAADTVAPILQKSSALSSERPDVLSKLIELVLYGAKYGRAPAFLHFSFATKPYAFLDVRSFGDRSFPPANGFTFMAWIQIEEFDKNRPLVIFNVRDEDQKSFYQIRVEHGGSRKLSIGLAGKNFYRFESFTFREGCWYHVAILHGRARLTTPTIALYIDGVLVEQTKCPYPATPKRIYAVIGTPLDCRSYEDVKSPSLSEPPGSAIGGGGKGAASCILSWNLGPMYLFEDVLDHDTIAIAYNLGPDTTAISKTRSRNTRLTKSSTALILI